MGLYMVSLKKVILTKDNLTKRKWGQTNVVPSAMHKR
uniref:Uncharacterized protein n=1 Tax=Oryza barthii TaxID=65489 RepID=A0A0D3F289_9ORYZ